MQNAEERYEIHVLHNELMRSRAASSGEQSPRKKESDESGKKRKRG